MCSPPPPPPSDTPVVTMYSVGIALIGANTDLNEARSLSFKNDIIDIYSNSWGPPDSGFHVEGPGELTKMALQSGVTEVNYIRHNHCL